MVVVAESPVVLSTMLTDDAGRITCGVQAGIPAATACPTNTFSLSFSETVPVALTACVVVMTFRPPVTSGTPAYCTVTVPFGVKPRR